MPAAVTGSLAGMGASAVGGAVAGTVQGALMAPVRAIRGYRAHRGDVEQHNAALQQQDHSDRQTNQVIQNTVAIKELRESVAKLSIRTSR